MRRMFAAPLLALLLGFVATAAAAPPAPLGASYFSFPGAHAHPPSARSAALALADRWLAGPWDNPAGAGGGPRDSRDPGASRSEVQLSGALLRSSRQDLVRQNRRFDDQPFFLDAAGGSIGWASGRFGVSLYAAQPVLRLEDNVFSRGTDPTAEPATILTTTSAREQRAGLAIAWGGDALNLGAAAEWTRRDDRYQTEERSGSPSAGTRLAAFSGDGIGGTAGARMRFGGEGPGAVLAGAAFRWIPAITLEGEQEDDLQIGIATSAITAEREAGWEAGASVEVTVTPAFKALAGFGGHGGQAWEGFGVTRGPGSGWSVGGEYHDARDPWIARFGFGLEEERGVPEPRAGRLALGFSWLLDTTRLDLGVVHRSIERPGQPDSSEDRVVVTLVQAL